jgi:hypothetical protein
MARSNRMSGAGGGPGSRVVKQQQVRTGRPAGEMRPAGVSQIGASMGNHATDSGKTLRGAVEAVRGSKVPAGGSVPLGNQTALNAGQGAGAGRTVMRSGSQQQHGPVAGSPKPQGADILSSFGPESKPMGRR